MADVSLNLLVLKTRQVDRLLAFYQALGIEFSEEQHSKGPRHHAGRVGDVVIEIYPLPDEGTADSSARLGFSVGNLAEVAQALQAIGTSVVKVVAHALFGLSGESPPNGLLVCRSRGPFRLVEVRRSILQSVLADEAFCERRAPGTGRGDSTQELAHELFNSALMVPLADYANARAGGSEG